jgi:flagellar biosynthetic protein FlhB
VSASDKSSKTEKPTPKRKREARKEGRVAKSSELTAWGSVLVGSFLVQTTVRNGGDIGKSLMAQTAAAAAAPDTNKALELFGTGMIDVAKLVAPLAIGIMVLGVVGNLAQTGWMASGSRLKPKFERLNPWAGMKKLLSPASLWEAAKSVLKLGLLTLVCLPPIMDIARLLSGTPMGMGAMLSTVGKATVHMVRNAAAAGLLLAIVDYGMQKRRLMKSLMMTKQEIKEEHRQAEGDPHVKGQIRQRQVAMSRNRMISNVARADAVIVNPIHVAVAIRYEAEKGAPRVVAKGQGEVATKIREEAERHGIPLVQEIQLARTLYKMCEVDQEIPLDLYEAVARLLAFVFALRRRGVVPGIHQLPPQLRVA